MLRDSMIRAVSDALARIEEIDAKLAEFEALREEKRSLQQFCNSTTVLVEKFAFGRTDTGVPGSTIERISPRDIHATAANALNPNEQYLWKAIHVVMGLKNKPMTAQEVLEALEAQQFEVTGNHKREAIRVALMRKPEVFERVNRGLFVLRNWPDTVKALADHHEPSDLLNEEDSPNELAEAV